MQCDQFRQLADSYLNNELIVETNHAVISHLEDCAECRHELAARRELCTRLRQAFKNAPENQMRPEFVSRVSSQLRDDALRKRVSVFTPNESGAFGRKRMMLAFAACLVLAAGIGLVLFRERIFEQTHPSTQGITQAEPTTSNSPQFSSDVPVNLGRTELARSAVGDHQNCAIHFRLTEKPIDLEVAGQKYDPVYINLAKVVEERGRTPLDVEVVEAHSCVFEARRYAHLVLKYHGRLVSLLVTDTATATAVPSLSHSQVIACSQFDGYQVSCFQTWHHAIFVVSDMPEGENLTLARALESSVYAHITRIENAG